MRGFRYEAGLATGMGEPVSMSDMGKIKLTEEMLTPDLQDATVYAYGSRRAPTLDTNNTASDIFSIIKTIETQRWQRKVESNAKTAMHLENLYGVLHRMAPEGFIADSTTRAQSIEELKAVFSKRSQPELDDALDFLNSLGGDRGIGPSFKSNRSGSYHNTEITRGSGVRSHINLDHKEGLTINPQNTFYHEVAHWA